MVNKLKDIDYEKELELVFKKIDKNNDNLISEEDLIKIF